MYFYMMKVFGIPNYIRLVLTTPLDKTREACERILEFCLEHQKTINARALRRMKSFTRPEVGPDAVAMAEESILPFHVKSNKFK
jgi:hypothetical protein